MVFCNRRACLTSWTSHLAALGLYGFEGERDYESLPKVAKSSCLVAGFVPRMPILAASAATEMAFFANIGHSRTRENLQEQALEHAGLDLFISNAWSVTAQNSRRRETV
jgi:hypothetical protein